MKNIDLNDYPQFVTLGYMIDNGYNVDTYNKTIYVDKDVIDEAHSYNSQICIKEDFYNEVVNKFSDVGITIENDNYHKMFLVTKSYTDLENERKWSLNNKEQSRISNLKTCLECIKNLNEEDFKYVKTFINQVEK